MANRISNGARQAILALLFASLLAGSAFSQNLTISVSPTSITFLDANQSAMAFNAVATGGTPFPGQNSIYTYQWYVKANTSCPGISLRYQYTVPVFKYSPNGTTPDCMMTALATDYRGASASATTGKIVVNPQFYSSGILARSAYNVTQGQTATITMNAPTGGTPSYSYQWLASEAVGGAFSASTANSLCSASTSTGLECQFKTSASTPPGIYGFELVSTDDAATPVLLVSNSILVWVEFSANALPAGTSSTSTSTAATTTLPGVQASTTAYTTIPATAPTTSVAQPTIQISLPNGTANIAVEGWEIAVMWVNRVLRYLV